MATCAECGFSYDLERAQSTGADLIRREAAAFTRALAASAEPATRRDPLVWSPLEYACHTRDMLLTQRERVLLARRVERPDAIPMGRDERVEHDGYAEQDPATVGEELLMAARLFGGVLDRLGPADWRRTVMYSFPAWTERSLAWITDHTLHELRHHLRDIRRQNAVPRSG